MSLTVQDLEKMQQQYPDYRMELVKGNILVMSPSGYEHPTRGKSKVKSIKPPRNF